MAPVSVQLVYSLVIISTSHLESCSDLHMSLEISLISKLACSPVESYCCSKCYTFFFFLQNLLALFYLCVYHTRIKHVCGFKNRLISAKNDTGVDFWIK